MKMKKEDGVESLPFVESHKQTTWTQSCWSNQFNVLIKTEVSSLGSVSSQTDCPSLNGPQK